MKEIYKAGLKKLKQGETIVVITAIAKEGSTPRGVGAKMLVTAGKDIAGTVGGGKVEEDLIKEADQLFSSKKSTLRSFDMTHEDLVPGHMVCGGKMDFLLEYFPDGDESLQFFEAVLNSFTRKEPLLISTAWKPGQKTPIIRRGLVGKDGLVYGEIPFHEAFLDQIKARADKQKQPQLLADESDFCWLEPTMDQACLYLFGAGHVALPVAEIASRVGFQVVALDDREACANTSRFPPPMGTKVVQDFDNCMMELGVDEDSFLVIVTRAHIHDKTVLAQALKTRAGYIGMIGSRKKRAVIYNALKDEGFSDNDLQRVFSPIGLEIKAETPEEIAVSIVAELIRVRAETSETQ